MDKKTKPVIPPALMLLTALAAAVICCALFTADSAEGPLIPGGGAAPETFLLAGEIRLEKTAALKKEYRVCDILDGTLFFTAKTGDEPLLGTVMPGGGGITPLCPLGGRELPEASAAENEALIYGNIVISAVRDGRACVLGVKDSGTGETETLFDADGKKWQLDEPRFYGEYIVVRIYHCDCVYRVTYPERTET